MIVVKTRFFRFFPKPALRSAYNNDTGMISSCSLQLVDCYATNGTSATTSTQRALRGPTATNFFKLKLY